MTHEHTETHVIIVGHGYRDYRTEQAILAPYGVRRIHQIAPDAPDYATELARAHAILVRETPIDAATIHAAPNLRVIVRYGIGVDNIDLAAARERRIHVANVPEYGIEDVSDHALALFLALERRIVTRDRQVRAGHWNIGQAEPMRRTATLQFGLLGYGRIAKAFHRKIHALGARRVLIHDPAVTEPGDDYEAVDFATLVRQSDVLSLHAPLTPHTRHIIDREVLARMKPGAILINTARGALVDEHALLDAVRKGRIRAGLDVFEHEPPPADHPLYDLENVVLSDHTGWYSESSVEELQRGAATEIARVLAGGTPHSWLNPWSDA